MKRLLFVDDDAHVLEGIEGYLRKQRKVWAMTFVTGGEEALQELVANHFDVIVSDMRMPGMDGAALLRRVQEDYPHVIRIVLSGQTEREVSRQLVQVAHQFIAKPCRPGELETTIGQAFAVQALLEQPALRQVVGKIGQLPVKPRVYSQLVQLLEDPRATTSDAAEVIEADIGTSSKVLQVVNSAFFGLSHRVGDIPTAVSYLGLEMVKALVLSVEIRQTQTDMRLPPGFSLDELSDRALRAARNARKLLPDKVQGQDAFTAAVLQDCGLLVLMSRLPEVFREIVSRAQGDNKAFDEIEREVLGVTHGEIGAYLLGIWGLPYSIVEAVAYHHSPQKTNSVGLDVTCAVHIASALAGEELLGSSPGCNLTRVTLDESHLAKLGLLPQVPQWRAAAAPVDPSRRA